MPALDTAGFAKPANPNGAVAAVAAAPKSGLLAVNVAELNINPELTEAAVDAGPKIDEAADGPKRLGVVLVNPVGAPEATGLANWFCDWLNKLKELPAVDTAVLLLKNKPPDAPPIFELPPVPKRPPIK